MGEREDEGGGDVVIVRGFKWNIIFTKINYGWVGAKDCSSTSKVLCRIFIGEAWYYSAC